jgi:membrane-associated phospholipid phosphatase
LTVSLATRARWYALFVAHSIAYLQAFKLPHRRHEAELHRLRTRYPIGADRVIGGGVVAMLWLIARHPRSFPRAAILVGAAFDVSLAYQAAVPTAPPWWAAQQAILDEPLHRVTVDASRSLPLIPEESADARQEANPWASMPSNHTASAVTLALALADVDRRVGAAAGAYAATLMFALVYLGEHYASDVIAGAAEAFALHALVPRVCHRCDRVDSRRRIPGIRRGR